MHVQDMTDNGHFDLLCKKSEQSVRCNLSNVRFAIFIITQFDVYSITCVKRGFVGSLVHLR